MRDDEKVNLRGGPSTYQWDAHDQPIDMIDMDGLMVKTEGEFRARASLADGINGQCPVDTTYDNTREFWVHEPRSTLTDRPIRSEGSPGSSPGGYGQRLARGGRPNHEGVGNPAPIDVKKGLYPHRLY